MKHAYSLLLIPVTALTFTACGGGGGGTTDSGHSMAGHSMAGHSMGGTSAPASSGHNYQDVMFAQMMIPHHQQAIVMAKQAATKASSPEVRKLAARIEGAQNPEIEKMTGWLKSWGSAMPSSDMGMSHGAGMMSARDMADLGKLSGKRFDRAFLQMMIKHHQGAITMAKTEQAGGASTAAKALAGSIVAAQSAEVATMRNLLAQM
jgi:uncharacterized protein (DUF305 family)